MNEIINIPGGTFEPEDHIYKDSNGLRVPSVTQVFSILNMTSFDHIQKEILERKSAIGVATHSCLQFLCEGALDWDEVDSSIMGYVTCGESWLKESGFVSLKREQQGIHQVNGMKYGYQYDNLGEIDYKNKRRKVILDYKTCVNESPTWALQTAAYALAAEPLTGEEYLRIVLQLFKDKPAKPYFFEDRTDKNTWLYALHTSIWMLNHGYSF